jgi:hypothetical protein
MGRDFHRKNNVICVHLSNLWLYITDLKEAVPKNRDSLFIKTNCLREKLKLSYKCGGNAAIHIQYISC